MNDLIEMPVIYLKNLIFNDSMTMCRVGCNHNAMDRSCIYDRFVRDIDLSNFQDLFDKAQTRYEEEKAKFVPRHKVTFVGTVILPNTDTGNHWDTVEEIEDYAMWYATNMINILLKRKQ